MNFGVGAPSFRFLKRWGSCAFVRNLSVFLCVPVSIYLAWTESPKSPPIPMKAGGIWRAAQCALQKTLDFLDAFMVNNCMREYENSSRWHPPAPIPALDCTVNSSAAPAFPPKIGFNFNSSQARNPSENTAILIAWLIANGNHSQNSITTLNSAGYKFLIASISYEFEGANMSVFWCWFMPNCRGSIQ
jgi:hypothetical protein